MSDLLADNPKLAFLTCGDVKTDKYWLSTFSMVSMEKVDMNVTPCVGPCAVSTEASTTLSVGPFPMVDTREAYNVHEVEMGLRPLVVLQKSPTSGFTSGSGTKDDPWAY